MLDRPWSEIWCLEKRQVDSQPGCKRSLAVAVPLPLTKFPYLEELPAATGMLDNLLAYGNIYPRAVKTGVDSAKTVVC